MEAQMNAKTAKAIRKLQRNWRERSYRQAQRLVDTTQGPMLMGGTITLDGGCGRAKYRDLKWSAAGGVMDRAYFEHFARERPEYADDPAPAADDVREAA